MKHQYFGDINDFRKYSLLQILCEEAKLRLGVCWMLTPNDGRNDGSRTSYLEAPQSWRPFNPELFDLFVACVKRSGVRDLRLIESRGLVPWTQFYTEVLSDSAVERRSYFSEMLRQFAKVDLVFFDPDNGLEVASVRFGARNSSKYLYWEEVSKAFKAKHSILIYQHFRREKHTELVATLAAMLSDNTGALEVNAFRTSHVVFLLAVQGRHSTSLRRAAARVGEKWAGQFEVRSYHSTAAGFGEVHPT